MTDRNDQPFSYDELMERYGHVGRSADVAHAVLRHCIIHGNLPPGSRFLAEDLAKELGMSRTPVREAQLKLEAEGLLAIKPGVGLVVQDFSEDQILEVFYVREALEGMAAALAAENATAHERRLLRGLLDDFIEGANNQEFSLLRDLSGQFHLAVGRAAHNTFLYNMVEEMQDKFRRFQPSTLNNPERAHEAVQEYSAIFDAIEARDPKAAEQAARQHRQRTLQLHIKRFRPSLAAQMSGTGRL